MRGWGKEKGCSFCDQRLRREVGHEAGRGGEGGGEVTKVRCADVRLGPQN